MVTAADARLWAVLETVPDPEIPALNVVEMGIVRAATVGPPAEVVLTPTYSGCPAMHAIRLSVEAALHAAGFDAATVRLVHAPPWTTDWLTAGARAKLRAYGIAPPAGRSHGLFDPGPTVACPRCGSAATERLSEFGATACKAQYRCTACREPFEYFKCI